MAEASYRESITLASESDQRTALALGLAGLAWLLARRGRADECRAQVAAALVLSRDLGARYLEVWAAAALGDLEVTLGDMAAALAHFEEQDRLLAELGITDPDLSPDPELVEAYVRLGRPAEARERVKRFARAAVAKGQPWSRARALRCQGLVAGDCAFAVHFERALEQHARTPDAFETARTRLAYGERLRRARNRVAAREQLRAAAETFERISPAPRLPEARHQFPPGAGPDVRERGPGG